jgi:leucine dehydrogenase
MTYKAAISGLPHGGGKAVIVRPKGLTDKQRVRIFSEFGKFVESLGGSYITCEDSGTSVPDMTVVKQHTDHVLGYDPSSGSSGDPSPLTALGVRRGIEAAAKFRWQRNDLDGLHVAIQGVGHVGYYLAKELHALGAQMTIADMNNENVERCVRDFGVKVVAPAAIYGVKCDVFAPCALGSVLNDSTIPRLACEVVAGASNNQLAETRHGLVLKERNILYAPDYALNAGGLINVAQEYVGHDPAKVQEKVGLIYNTMMTIFERGMSENLPMDVVADRIVEERLYN